MASSQMRISGVNSGFDTEAMIQQMMSAYQTKIDNQNKKLQKLQWQQEQYRDITSKLTTFKSKYFDILKRDTYLMSPSSFNKFATTITTKSGKESGLKVTTDSKSTAGSHTIKVTNRATAATLKGGSFSSSNFKLDVDKAMADAQKDESGKYNFALDVKVGNVAKTVEFSGADKDEILASLQTELTDAFGTTNSGNPFITAQLDAKGNFAFNTAGNAMATVTERTGNFGMGKPSARVAISPAAAQEGTSSISVTIPNYYDKSDVTKNIKFDTHTSGYFDGRDDDPKVKEEFMELKKAAFLKQYSYNGEVTEQVMNSVNFKYTSLDAADDYNKNNLEQALNSAFGIEQGVQFSVDGSSMTAKYIMDGSAVEFTMTSTCDATFGLVKGSGTSYVDETTKLSDLGISMNKAAVIKTDYTMPDLFNLDLDAAIKNANSSDGTIGADGKYSFSLEVGVDGNKKTISFTGADKAELVSSLNSALSTEFGANGLKAVEKDGTVSFEMTSGKTFSVKQTQGKFAEPLDEVWNDAGNVNYQNQQLKITIGADETTVNVQGLMTTDKIDSTDSDAVDLLRKQNQETIVDTLNEAYSGENITFEYADDGKLTAKDADGNAVSFTSEVVPAPGVGAGNDIEYTFPEYTESAAGYSMTINGTEITVGENATVKDLISAVNKSDAGVTMSYSKLEGAFTVTANDKGNGGDVDIAADDSLAAALGLTGAGSKFTSGSNAVISVDGVEIEHNDNVYELDGVTYDFSDVDDDFTEPITVNIDKSYDDIKKTIKSFVEDYNKMIDEINGYTQTQRPTDKNKDYYEPLTDEEKEDMSDKEIEKWEEAAKKGLLYHDSTVMTAMSKIRNAMSTYVTLEDGSRFGLSSMGIKTASFLDADGGDGAKYGKLKIDEDALDKAFEENSDKIIALFTDLDNGVMSKVNKAIESATKDTNTSKGTLVRKAGLATGTSAKDNSIYKEMERINKRIEQLQDRYDKKEEYWWTVFTNLEKMQAQFDSQQSYITQFTANGGYLSS